MTVKELIQRLQQLDQDAVVHAFDADEQEVVPVTGLLSTQRMVEICTDDLS